MSSILILLNPDRDFTILLLLRLGQARYTKELGGTKRLICLDIPAKCYRGGRVSLKKTIPYVTPYVLAKGF